jgi:glycerol-3-phosphate dehydrogenase subunit C
MKPVNKTVVYHTPCHLERSGNTMFTIELLKSIPGIKLKVLDSQCCGSAGTYGFKSENYAASMAIGEGLFKQIEESDADLAITDCETCKWQIEENTALTCIHPVSLIAQAIAAE